jgi:hypothetical protein
LKKGGVTPASENLIFPSPFEKGGLRGIYNKYILNNFLNKSLPTSLFQREGLFAEMLVAKINFFL